MATFYCEERDMKVDLAECRKASVTATFGSPCENCEEYQRREQELEESEKVIPALEETAEKRLAVDMAVEVKRESNALKSDRLGICQGCGEEKWILGQGLCNGCHRKKYPRKKQKKRKVKTVAPQSIKDARSDLSAFDTGHLIQELRLRLPEAKIVLELPVCQR